MTAARCRVGVIGFGWMGQSHCRTLRSMDGVQLIGVADADETARSLATRLGLHAVDRVEELIERGMDYCVVASPTSSHTEIALQLAESAVSMLVEKPIALTCADAMTMVDAFARKGLLGAVGHVERFNPALVQLRMRLERGDLGAVYQVSTRRVGPYPARIGDVGVVLDLATHDIDIARFVTESEYSIVCALTGHRSGRQHEDLVAVTGLLHNGVIVNHLVNWLSPIKERVTVVTGELGAFTASTLTGDLTFAANGTATNYWQGVAHFRGVSEGDVITYAYPKHEPLRREHEDFLAAMRGEQSNFVSLIEGARTLATAEQVLESAQQKVSISVDVEGRLGFGATGSS